MDSLIYLITFILCPNILSFPLIFLTRDNIKYWYEKLNKPKFTPQSWMFGPLWGILYSVIGYSGFLIWEKNQGFQWKNLLEWSVYSGQLFSNYLWYYLFFGMKEMLFAFYEIIVMLILITLNVFLFYRISNLAGLILLPYLVVVLFSTYLTYSFIMVNKVENYDDRRKSIELIDLKSNI